MTYPYPQGTLSAFEATIRVSTRLSQHRNYQGAWRAICGGILKVTIPAYVLDSAGQSHEADRAQFAALGDQDLMMLDFRQFASTTLESLDASCFPRKASIPGMPRILPPVFDVQARRVYGRLFFLKGDFDAAWWESMEPKTNPEAIAKWLRKNYGAHRPALLVEEILRAIRGEHWQTHPRSGASPSVALALAWR
jgi:hypothetical protein